MAVPRTSSRGMHAHRHAGVTLAALAGDVGEIGLELSHAEQVEVVAARDTAKLRLIGMRVDRPPLICR